VIPPRALSRRRRPNQLFHKNLRLSAHGDRVLRHPRRPGTRARRSKATSPLTEPPRSQVGVGSLIDCEIPKTYHILDWISKSRKFLNFNGLRIIARAVGLH
jgi:hypothetical protein